MGEVFVIMQQHHDHDAVVQINNLLTVCCSSQYSLTRLDDADEFWRYLMAYLVGQDHILQDV